MSRQAGAAGLIAAALAVIAMVACLLTLDVARLVAMREQVAAAADAAALAAAPATFAAFGTTGDPVAAAAEMAAANGAELLDCSCAVDRSWQTRRAIVHVGAEVRLPLLGTQAVTAMAAAEFRPIALARR